MTDALIPIAGRQGHGDSHAVARVASAAVAALALSVLVGWWLEQPTLQSGFGGVVAMNPMTAVAFILASTSLALQLPAHPTPRWRRLGRLCAVVVALIAALCLTRVLGAWDLGLDRVLFREQLARAGGTHPNRMAPNTAAAFLLVGLALLTLDHRTERGWRPAEVLALIAWVLGFTAVAGYVYRSGVLYSIGAFIPMAANTALGFLVLSSGVLCARPRQGLAALVFGRGAGALMIRRVLPAAIVVPLVLGWLRLEGERAGLYDPAGGVAGMVAATTLILALLVWRCAVELDRADAARGAAEQRLRELNERLETRVVDRTQDLKLTNEELRREAGQRRLAQEELRETADELRAIFDASPLAICSLTRDGQVRSWNRAAEQLFGWSAAEAVGRPLANIPADLAGEYQALRERVLAGSPFTNHETRRVHKDGHELDVSISTAALRDASGVAQGLVAVYMDVGGRKALEAQLRQAQKMEAVGRLAGGVAHDFNNMLSVILGNSGLLLDDLDARRPACEPTSVEIREAGDAGGQPHPAAPGLQPAAGAAAAGRSISTRSSREMQPMLRRLLGGEHRRSRRACATASAAVHADRSQLEQVMLNLVVNARDAMPSGGRLLIETADVSSTTRIRAPT